MKHSVPAQTENDLIDFYRNASLEPRQLSSNLGRVYLLSCEARPYFIVF